MQKLSDEQVATFVAAYPAAKQNELLLSHTFLKIGGPARLYIVVQDADIYVSIIEFAKKISIPFYIIGGGSNILVSDTGYEGVIIQMNMRGSKIEETVVSACAGDFTGLIARLSADAGLIGFEWGVGVPGTIGGAIYGNAGCFGGEMKDAVASVCAYDILKEKKVTYSNGECMFGYRDSRFKHEPHIIFGMTMVLERGNIFLAKKKIEDIMSKRKDTQPQGAFSAGCLFKNFEYKNTDALSILQRDVEVPSELLKVKKIPAGWLIDTLGLKGYAIGRAQVSSVHGNFLVNLGGARAQDVLALSSYVKMKVRDAYGILLEDEVQYVGF